MIKRFFLFAVALFVTIAVTWFGVRPFQNEHDLSAASKVIVQLGGTIGSIHPPLGIRGEYRIEFPDRSFARSDLEQLDALNPLASRDWVGIHFKGELSNADIQYLRELVPGVAIWVKGERVATAVVSE